MGVVERRGNEGLRAFGPKLRDHGGRRGLRQTGRGITQMASGVEGADGADSPASVMVGAGPSDVAGAIRMRHGAMAMV